MMMTFDRNKLHVASLAERKHDLDLSCILPLQAWADIAPGLAQVAARLQRAKERNAARILMMGAHVLRSGVQRYLIDLLEQRDVSCVALNGAGVIHDFEFALIGATTESVARYIEQGQFGLWRETGRINDIVAQAAREGMGLGETVGKAIHEGDFPFKEHSLLAAAYRLQVPVTVHVGIGYDIVHEQPNCDGAAYGAASYRDFLTFARIVENLENGVVMNFGSAIMAPEIYLKALSMARNVAFQEGRSICRFATLVCDLLELPEDFRQEPSRNNPAYYFRPWKTMLVRTVADGGESFYVRGRHAETVPQLWTALQGCAAPKEG